MSPPRPSKPRSNIRRTRTGCLTCRERRVRCDEEKPICHNCSKKSRGCTWGQDVRFLQHRPSISNRPIRANTGFSSIGTSGDNIQSPEFSLRRTDTEASVTHIPPVSATVLGPPRDGHLSSILNFDSSQDSSASPSTISSARKPSASSTDGISPGELSCWSSEVLQSLTEDPHSSITSIASSICRSQSARLKQNIDLEHAGIIPPNLEPNAEAFTNWQTLGASELVLKALNSDLEMRLLKNYLWECAPWFDAHNAQRHYSRKDVPRMMSCPPWRAAALALSAKNIELRKKRETTAESLSLHLYQLAVTLAIDSISGRFDCVGTTAGCVLLAVYEMMTVTYEDWRRHLQGCTSIYSHNHWNGDSLGLISASFWGYARIDIWAAFCAGTETMLPTEDWFHHPRTIMRSMNVNEDRHAQIATWLLARVVNMKHSSKSFISSDEHLRLKDDLSNWQSLGAAITKPVMQLDTSSSADCPFPSILFSSDSSVIAYTMYHTAMVLLLEFESLHRALPQMELAQNIYEHARVACGIIETNSHTSCLVNSVQPVWICGRHLKTKSEKFAALELLAQIEQKTGWKTKWRSDSLRQMWNLC